MKQERLLHILLQIQKNGGLIAIDLKAFVVEAKGKIQKAKTYYPTMLPPYPQNGGNRTK